MNPLARLSEMIETFRSKSDPIKEKPMENQEPTWADPKAIDRFAKRAISDHSAATRTHTR